MIEKVEGEHKKFVWKTFVRMGQSDVFLAYVEADTADEAVKIIANSDPWLIKEIEMRAAKVEDVFAKKVEA